MVAALKFHTLAPESPVDRQLKERRTYCGKRGRRYKGIRYLGDGYEFKAISMRSVSAFRCAACERALEARKRKLI